MSRYLGRSGHTVRRKRGVWWNERTWSEPVFICELEVLCWRLSDAEYLEEYMSMSSFAKMFGKAVSQVESMAASDADMEARHPNLFALLTHLKDDAGQKRQTATLTVCCEQGLWKAGVKDRDHSMSLWRSGDTFTAVLDALETALDSGQADWKVQTSSRK